jgi:hypothetical protein
MEYNEFDRAQQAAGVAIQGKKPIPPWLKYLWAGMIGFTIGAGIVMGLANTLLRDAQKVASGLADEKLKLYSTGTILYEDAASCHEDVAGIPILDGYATIHINGMTVEPPKSGVVPRWYIPMNVQPLSIANGPGAKVTHFPIRNQNLTATPVEPPQ